MFVTEEQPALTAGVAHPLAAPLAATDRDLVERVYGLLPLQVTEHIASLSAADFTRADMAVIVTQFAVLIAERPPAVDAG